MGFKCDSNIGTLVVYSTTGTVLGEKTRLPGDVKERAFIKGVPASTILSNKTKEPKVPLCNVFFC